VKNDSTADMLFRLYAKNVSVTESGLADYINVKVTLRPDDGYRNRLGGDLYGPFSPTLTIYDDSLSGLIGVENALDNINAGCKGEADGVEYEPLWPGYVATYKVEVSLDWEAGNEYQGEELTADLQLDATQFNEDVCAGPYASGNYGYTAW
jgi:hypothetical protein